MFYQENPLSPEQQEKLDAALDRLVEEARKVGLVAAQLMVVPGDAFPPASSGPVKVVAQFTISDTAFSARVQDPKQAEFDDEFRRLAVASTEDEIEEIKKRYRKMGSDE